MLKNRIIKFFVKIQKIENFQNQEKGRQQQIIALQARIKELERIKLQSQENPSQIKQVKKDYQDFIEKYKKEIKEKDVQIAESNKKVSIFLKSFSTFRDT